jgi:hypothetical protein
MARLATNDGLAHNLDGLPIFELNCEKERPPKRLVSSNKAYDFTFCEEKSLFTLGSSEQVDFVVKEVAKKYLSFVRDLNGIRVIPLFGQEMLINGQAQKEPRLLCHKDILKVGSLELVFLERPLEDAKKVVALPDKKRILLAIFDRLFAGAFLVVLLGSLVRFFELV